MEQNRDASRSLRHKQRTGFWQGLNALKGEYFQMSIHWQKEGRQGLRGVSHEGVKGSGTICTVWKVIQSGQ